MSMPLVNILPNKEDATENITVQWKDGIVQSNVDDAFHAKSQSKGMQHTFDILGELQLDSLISPNLWSRGKASNKMFDNRLPLRFDPGAFPEPSEPLPQKWFSAEQSGKRSMSEKKSLGTTSAQNDLKMVNNLSKNTSRSYRSNNHHINPLS
jgi:hypothetical protein